MLRILIGLLATAQSFQVNISTLYPTFESYDEMPYMDIEVKTSSSLVLHFTEFEQLTIYHNTLFVCKLNQSSTVNFTLVPGYNELHVLEKNLTRIMIAYSNHSSNSVRANINGVSCLSTQVCNVTSNLLSFLGISIETQSIMHSLSSRLLFKESAFNLLMIQPGMNYFMLNSNGDAVVFSVYLVENNENLRSFKFETPGIKLFPRFQSNVYNYLIVPQLSFDNKTIDIRASTDSANCSIRLDSEKLFFLKKSVLSDSLATIQLIGQDDRIFVTTMCRLFSKSYAFSISFKSRLNYLSQLAVFIGSSDFPVTTYNDLNATLLPALSLKNTFNSGTFMVELNDFDYQPLLTLSLKPQSDKAKILVQDQDYLKTFVTFSPRVGQNTLNITVIAEDSLFSQDYYLIFYMRNNDSTIKTFNIPSIQPSFDVSTTVYRSFIDFSSSFIPIKVDSTDPKSMIVIEYENQTFSSLSSIETSLPFTSLNLFLTVKVLAESQSVASVYNITFIRLDLCGNGLRFSSDESCDDGNLVNGDGCSNDCKVESGWDCFAGSSTSKDSCIKLPSPEGPPAVCGNSIKEKDEECDDLNDSQCVNCLLIPSICGNGVREKGEECDDGNTLNDDGCSQCKKDSNGAVCGDGLRVFWSDEQCDDGNLIQGDGCSDCKVESGWECSNSSITSLPLTSPDICWLLSNNTGPDESPEDSTENMTSNVTDTETQKQDSDQSENSWDDFAYLGTVSFFIVLVLSSAITAANALIGNDKIGIAVIPGVLTPLWMLQVVFCFESGSKALKSFFRSFGWAHLHFSQPIRVESRRLTDLLGTQIPTEPLFLENVQYWIFVFFLLVLISGICWLILPKHSASKVQKLIFLYFYFFSAVPLAYFSVHSFISPDLSTIAAVVSFVFAIMVLAGYFCVFAYLVFSLLCCSPEDSEVSNLLTLGLRFSKQQPNTSRTNDGKYEQSLPNVVERVSLEEESSGCQDEDSDRKLDKTRVKVQSAPISVFKYKSPEKLEVPYLYEIEFRFLHLVIFAGLTSASIVLAAGREVEYLACSLAVSILVLLLVFVAWKPAYQYTCYKLCHIVCLLMLVIISGLLISQDQKVSSCSYYFVIFLVFSLLCCYVHQLVWILLLWMNVPSSEVKELVIKPQEASISYVRDSIPEERAPNSATINNISYEISMSVN